MTVLLDHDARTLSAGVHDLLGEPVKRSIGLMGDGMSRLWIGQELHRRVQSAQEASEPGYRSEVSVRTELPIDGWAVTVVGRADGVVETGGRVTRVDEIKTLHFAVDLHNLYHQETLDRFRAQLRIYAWLLSDPDAPAAARLVLVDVSSGEERHEEVAWTPSGVHAWVRAAVHRLVAAERGRLERREALRRASETLPFPHPERRPGQQRISEAVDEALETDRHLLLSAPTGTGKTAAVLHPALRHAMATGRRLYVLTAKTLQQKMAVETLRRMGGDSFRSLQLRAKAKMCANTEVICHPDCCPWAEGYGAKLVRTGIVPRLLGADHHLDPDELFATARDQEVCPFEVSLDLLGAMDAVVCDYNYAFDPTIGLGALRGEGALEEAILVIDEAHNLVERGREYYSPVLDTGLVERAAKFLGSRDAAPFRNLRGLADAVGEMIREAATAIPDGPGEAEALLDRRRIGDLRLGFDAAMVDYFALKKELELWLADDPVLELFLGLIRFQRTLELGGDEFVHLVSRDGRGVESLKILCLDASRFLGEILDRCAGAVAMSATLEPFEFYRDLLGFDPDRTDTLSVGSPFPAEHRLVMAIGDVDTTWRRRRQHADAIAGWIGRLAEPGHNALVLFPSYDFLDHVASRTVPRHHELIVQRRGSTDADQRELLEVLNGPRPTLVLAVLGGIFAEGVDYPGRMLSQVMVVSPGLPPFTPERELLRSYYSERYEHGFGYAYLIPGMTRVIQAAGRLIRSEDDRGVITLLCRRFLDPRYARLLPEEWTEGDPATLVHADPEAAVRSFFAAAPLPDRAAG